jgi:Protein of unknown function (DUF3099)
VQRDRQSKPVYEITGARRGLTEDVTRRQIRYAISMGIRTVCFVLAIVTHGWLRAVFLIGALVLPYLSVVYANSGRERVRAGPPGYQPGGPAAIDPVRTELPRAEKSDQGGTDSRGSEGTPAPGPGSSPGNSSEPGPATG